MYRSRLEAKWATVFDEYKLNYEYEPRVFTTPIGGYLPDFYFNDHDLWVEVKPKYPSDDERTKLAAVEEQVSGRCWFLCGFPHIYNMQWKDDAMLSFPHGGILPLSEIWAKSEDADAQRATRILARVGRSFESRSVGDLAQESVMGLGDGVEITDEEMVQRFSAELRT